MVEYYFEGETAEPRAHRYSAQMVLDPITFTVDADDSAQACAELADLISRVEVIAHLPNGHHVRMFARAQDLEEVR